jgi:hypothetical protein
MRVLILILICLPLSTAFAQSEKTAKEKNKERIKQFEEENNPYSGNATSLLKTNPLPILWGPIPFTAEYRLNFETIISRRESVEIGGSFLGRSLLLSMIQTAQNQTGGGNLYVQGYRFQFAYKIFVGDILEGMKSTTKQESLTGLYIAAHTSYSTANLSGMPLRNASRYIQVSHFNINFLFGAQEEFFDDKIFLDIHAGLGYRNNQAWNITRNSITPNNDFEELYFFPRNLKIILGFNIGFAF